MAATTVTRDEARAEACEVVAEAMRRAADMLSTGDQYGKGFDKWAQSLEDRAVELRPREGLRVIPGGRR